MIDEPVEIDVLVDGSASDTITLTDRNWRRAPDQSLWRFFSTLSSDRSADQAGHAGQSRSRPIVGRSRQVGDNPEAQWLSCPIPSAPILVVGDIMCDHYVWGDVERISPEAPVQVLRWEREADRPGGAANAALNLAALGCRVRLVGVIGNDEPGRWLLRTLKRARIDTRASIRSTDRPTTLKTRVMARGQHMLRIDRETRAPLSARDERLVVARREERREPPRRESCARTTTKAFSPRQVFRAIVERRGKTFVAVDPKSRNFRKYRGADLLTPNEKELAEATSGHIGPTRDADIKRRAERLMRTFGFKAILVTRGSSGMDLFESDRRTIRRTHIPASSAMKCSTSQARATPWRPS